MEIYDRLKEARKARGYQQKDFADKLGLSRTAYSNYENGIRGLTQGTIYMICDVLDIDEEWLRTGEGTMDRKLTTEESIATFAGKIASDPDALPALTRFLEKLSKMDVEELEAVDKYLDLIMNK